MSGKIQYRWPADFDPAECPIIALHWFGAEPLCPTVQIVAEVIAVLAHTMVANTNSPQN